MNEFVEVYSGYSEFEMFLHKLKHPGSLSVESGLLLLFCLLYCTITCHLLSSSRIGFYLSILTFFVLFFYRTQHFSLQFGWDKISFYFLLFKTTVCSHYDCERKWKVLLQSGTQTEYFRIWQRWVRVTLKRYFISPRRNESLANANTLYIKRRQFLIFSFRYHYLYFITFKYITIQWANLKCSCNKCMYALFVSRSTGLRWLPTIMVWTVLKEGPRALGVLLSFYLWFLFLNLCLFKNKIQMNLIGVNIIQWNKIILII